MKFFLINALHVQSSFLPSLEYSTAPSEMQRSQQEHTIYYSAFRGTLLDEALQETWIITADSRCDFARRRKAAEKLHLLFCDDFLYLHSSSGKATHDAKPIEAGLFLEMSEKENRAKMYLATVLLV